MRNVQARFVDDLVAIEQDVNIQRPGAPDFRPDALILTFNPETGIQQLARRETGLGVDNRVEKPWLVPGIFWFGFINRRRSNHFDALVPNSKYGFS